MVELQVEGLLSAPATTWYGWSWNGLSNLLSRLGPTEVGHSFPLQLEVPTEGARLWWADNSLGPLHSGLGRSVPLNSSIRTFRIDP